MEKKKILIVDDEAEFAELIKTRLEANNYSASTLSDPKGILAAAKKEAPDLILLDIVMPQMDGYRICKLLKSKKETAGIPILLVTGKDLEPEGVYRRCLDLGINGFISKPVESKELITKLKEAIK